jgi:hypothetical protein
MKVPIAFHRLVSRLVARFRRRSHMAAFVPLVDDQGREVGLMDRMTAEYLQSNAPDPSQSSPDEVLTQATHIRVVDWEESDDGTLERTRVLAELADAVSLAQLRDCLRIIEDRATFAHCMCIGEEAIELHSPAGRIATIGLHHGRRIRWEAWKHDATLEDGLRLLRFLADRGVSRPLKRYEQTLHEGGAGEG